MNIELLFRFVGAIIFAAWAADTSARPFRYPSHQPSWLPSEFFGGAFGLVIGFLVAPYLTTRPAGFVVDHARRLHVKDLAAAVLGLLVSLVLSALLAIPLSDLPGILGKLFPFAGTLFMMYLGITIAVGRRDDIFGLLGLFPSHDREPINPSLDNQSGVLLDTSAIIDGRIVDIGRVGFLSWSGDCPTLRSPRAAAHRRFAGRHSPRSRPSRPGIARSPGKSSTVPIRIHDGDADGDSVDAKLVTLAQKLKYAIVTNRLQSQSGRRGPGGSSPQCQ